MLHCTTLCINCCNIFITSLQVRLSEVWRQQLPMTPLHRSLFWTRPLSLHSNGGLEDVSTWYMVYVICIIMCIRPVCVWQWVLLKCFYVSYDVHLSKLFKCARVLSFLSKLRLMLLCTKFIKYQVVHLQNESPDILLLISNEFFHLLLCTWVHHKGCSTQFTLQV